jgi:hypothetical protein
MSEFKDFLLNEARYFLAARTGDILNALQDLEEEAPHLGKRQMLKHAERVTAMIRRVLHSSWPKGEVKHLQGIQKIGVAIMKAIDEKDDLKEIISGSIQELQQVLNKMEVPLHDMGARDEESEAGEKEGPAPPKGKEKPEQQPGQPPATDATMAGQPPMALPPGQPAPAPGIAPPAPPTPPI